MTCIEQALLVDRIRFCSRFMMTLHQRAYRRISRAPSHLNFKRHSQRMPPKKPPTTSDGKTPSVAMFFKPVPRPGRPAKCAHARGRPCRPSTLDAIMIAGGAAPASGPPPLTVAAAAAAEHASSGQPPPPAAAASAEPMGKRKRANYDVPGPARDKLDAAIEQWQHGERPADIATGNQLSINKFAEQKELPPSVFKRRLKELGTSPAVQSAEIKGGGKRCPSSSASCGHGGGLESGVLFFFLFFSSGL